MLLSLLRGTGQGPLTPHAYWERMILPKVIATGAENLGSQVLTPTGFISDSLPSL